MLRRGGSTVDEEAVLLAAAEELQALAEWQVGFVTESPALAQRAVADWMRQHGTSFQDAAEKMAPIVGTEHIFEDIGLIACLSHAVRVAELLAHTDELRWNADRENIQSKS